MTAVQEPCDVVLRDGSTLTLRPPTPGDTRDLLGFFERLSARSQYQRFMGFPRLDLVAIDRLANVDPELGASLLGECGGTIVALAGFVGTHAGADRAEVAFAVADTRQGRGVGTRLLERLAVTARARGLQRFDAYVLGDNRQMLDVFLDSGFEVHQRLESGVYHVVLTLAATDRFEEQAVRRSREAAIASMRPFFEPRAVAVVGASRTRGKIGSEVLHNLVACGFTGRVIPVHPACAEVQGLTASPTVAGVQQPVDLAIVTVPAAQVLDAVDDCIAGGVRGICVISAGFGEADDEGRAREGALLDRIRRAGCRLIGPNCMGLVNTNPAFALNATFSPVYPPAGHVAMSTQSGALGLAILDYARRLNIGISSFVSVGNKADVSSNDLLQYWAEDPQTSVILLYLESFGNPRKFSQIARRVGRAKPIVAVKAGRSTAGARAASSHTGALATSDALVDALFKQSGVIRTDTLQELFDVATLLSNQPLPAGRRVAILTNAGGPGILAADACEANGLTMAPLGDDTRRALREFLPASASVANPVDMLASAPAGHYGRATEALLRDEAVDSLLVIFIPPLVTAPDDVATAIAASAREAGSKPVLGVFMRAEGAPPALAPIPCYPFPESAAIALARVSTYEEWRRRPSGRLPSFPDIASDEARRIVAEAMQTGRGWLTPDESHRLLAAVRIPTLPWRLVTTPDEAAAAAAEIGFPVVVKATGESLIHKTERRALILNLHDGEAVRLACHDLRDRLGEDASGFFVQRMVAGGVEMLVGAADDPTFGPLVMCGTGGIFLDLLADTSVRLHPLTDLDAGEMIGELRGARLLRGYRGAVAADEPALRETLQRVSALLTICPDVRELDINPLNVSQSGVCAVDVRIRVGPEPLRPRARRVEY
jgi:acetyl coenzyme A synthetase (ADP forming)-like protein